LREPQRLPESSFWKADAVGQMAGIAPDWAAGHEHQAGAHKPRSGLGEAGEHRRAGWAIAGRALPKAAQVVAPGVHPLPRWQHVLEVGLAFLAGQVGAYEVDLAGEEKELA